MFGRRLLLKIARFGERRTGGLELFLPLRAHTLPVSDIRYEIVAVKVITIVHSIGQWLRPQSFNDEFTRIGNRQIERAAQSEFRVEIVDGRLVRLLYSRLKFSPQICLAHERGLKIFHEDVPVTKLFQ